MWQTKLPNFIYWIDIVIFYNFAYVWGEVASFVHINLFFFKSFKKKILMVREKKKNSLHSISSLKCSVNVFLQRLILSFLHIFYHCERNEIETSETLRSFMATIVWMKFWDFTLSNAFFIFPSEKENVEVPIVLWLIVVRTFKMLLCNSTLFSLQAQSLNRKKCTEKWIPIFKKEKWKMHNKKFRSIHLQPCKIKKNCTMLLSFRPSYHILSEISFIFIWITFSS